MEILGIGGPEFIFILIIALIVIGPRDLGKTGRSIGRFLNKLYRSDSWRTLNEASRTLRTLPNRLAREAALDELDQVRKDMSKAGKDLAEPAKEIQEGLQAWTTGPEPDASPPPAKPTQRDPSPPPAKPTPPDASEPKDEATP